MILAYHASSSVVSLSGTEAKMLVESSSTYLLKICLILVAEQLFQLSLQRTQNAFRDGNNIILRTGKCIEQNGRIKLKHSIGKQFWIYGLYCSAFVLFLINMYRRFDHILPPYPPQLVIILILELSANKMSHRNMLNEGHYF